MEDYGDIGGGEVKVLVLGASGIIGQHMRLCCPEGVKATYCRKTADWLHVGVDLTDQQATLELLAAEWPDVIVNLAGESDTDKVELDPFRRLGIRSAYEDINVKFPSRLAEWCDKNAKHLIHVSSQAVFGGKNPPYNANSAMGAINEYGLQKSFSESIVSRYQKFTILRPTFVLGIRPLPHIGRPNPIEQILAGQRKQVNDRWFSVSFAEDVARELWRCVLERPAGIIHIGAGRMSRYDIAVALGCEVEAVSHDDFAGIAPRPIDTHYNQDAIDSVKLADLLYIWRNEFSGARMKKRARELALFFGKTEKECLDRLNVGWGPIHQAVTDDWNRANPKTEAEILDWYRKTESYIWELSFYHGDPGWNYSGMCAGIGERLKAAGAKRVLCLGDGIGDLTISLYQAGFDAVYHDLEFSRTAEFAQFRAWMYLGKSMPSAMSGDCRYESFDAIVSLDFLEHVTNVEAWVRDIHRQLRHGGLFCAQNAFAIGSGEQGSMPMHLSCNDRYEKDWDPMLAQIGFVQESSNWYRKGTQ